MKRILFALCCFAVCAVGAQKPNIIVFLTDDQDKESIGAYGADVWTPNLDRMAEEGMLFHNAFVTSTVCTPSRYSFLTGRYASRSTHDTFLHACPEGTQANPVFNVGLEPDNLNVGAMMKAEGYRTGYVGKFHASGIEGLNKPEDYAAFGMEFLSKKAAVSPETTEIFRKNELATRKLLTDRGFDWAKNVYLGNMIKPYADHNLEWTIDAALEFIEESKDEPFYLHFCTTLVHGPDAEWYRSMQNPLFSGEGELDAPVEPEGMLSRREILAELEKRGLNPEDGHAGYSWVDAGVGAILKKLKKLGLDDNTLVFFTADHGSHMKGSLWDLDGTCVPFIARWPNGIKAGSESRDLIQSIDIAATAYDLAGAELPEEYQLDGHSLTPLFGGKPPAGWRDHLYIELGTARAIRTKEFKYISIRYPQEKVTRMQRIPKERMLAELSPLGRLGIGVRGAANPNFWYEDGLYRIEKDPKEFNNLAGDPEYAPKLDAMQKILIAELESIGRPYGELIPGGNAVPPGQVDEQLELARQCMFQGKNIIFPGDAPGNNRKSD
ncbi:sulfatase family protein [Pontiella sulfatireligans]|uniref:Arylsulfatase n=1 Tax=Pontiella sulfatireligans TaxID=2750658 RepID=A0A6C2UNF8_9BACT|nr:sulfatase-like hydrolase/transferase [Pontiella sulfatireligans]SPS74455.1 sulfatase S1_51 [Kiritimatiellales bacterium]VGO20854.1 Arylsulfatase [Pontiella sulfatireligans]